jgi:hypothetical protein
LSETSKWAWSFSAIAFIQCPPARYSVLSISAQGAEENKVRG